jgi:hypothetical protein
VRWRSFQLASALFWSVEWFAAPGFYSSLRAMFSVRDGARFHISSADPELSAELNREFSLCSRVLFRDGENININSIGFWARKALALLTCDSSYTESSGSTGQIPHSLTGAPCRTSHHPFNSLGTLIHQKARRSAQWQMEESGEAVGSYSEVSECSVLVPRLRPRNKDSACVVAGASRRRWHLPN